MKIDLTKDEISTLISAVKCWEQQPEQDGTMEGIMSGLFDAVDPELRDLSPQERQQRAEKKRREQKDRIAALSELRRESSILLQAKLIATRNASND